MTTSPPVVEELGSRLGALDWVTDLLVGGSVAAGDYTPRISDIDLVALVDGPVDTARQALLTTLHRGLDEGTGWGLKLGCVYIDGARLLDTDDELLEFLTTLSMVHRRSDQAIRATRPPTG